MANNRSQTRVGVPQHAAYRSPLNFKNPDTFEPDRWLPNTGYDDDRRDAFQPFSHGPRNCLGKKYAHETLLLSKFKLIKFQSGVPRDACYICYCIVAL